MCTEQVCNCYLIELLKEFNKMTYMKAFCELLKLNQYLVLKNQSKNYGGQGWTWGLGRP